MKAQELVISCFTIMMGSPYGTCYIHPSLASSSGNLENLRPHRIILYDKRDEWPLISGG